MPVSVPQNFLEQIEKEKATSEFLWLWKFVGHNGAGGVEPVKSGQMQPGGSLLRGPQGVRRLTPRECERLQGFPNDWTAIPGASDSTRYKAIGNSMAVPVMRWIGEGVAEVDRI